MGLDTPLENCIVFPSWTNNAHVKTTYQKLNLIPCIFIETLNCITFIYLVA